MTTAKRRGGGRSALIGGFLAVALLALVQIGSPAQASTAPIARMSLIVGPSDIHKIKHVVTIMQENRSFDTYFGTYPGADGIPMGTDGTPSVCNPDPANGTCAKPFHDPTDNNVGGPHGFQDSKIAIDGGRMDGFLKTMRQAYGNKLPPDVMAYHDRSDIPNYWAYADHFTLADRMFESDASWTEPAHMFIVSAWAAICDSTDGPRTCRSDQTNPGQGGLGKTFDWTPITTLLRDYGQSWGYYIVNGTEPDCADPTKYQCLPLPNDIATPGIFNPLTGFKDVIDNHELGNIQSVSNFLTAAHNGTLPAVSWVIPNAAVSEHPTKSVAAGQAYVTLPHQHRDAGPRLGQHRDRPGLGRLGRLLRPCRPADRRRERPRHPGSRDRDQSLREAGLHPPRHPQLRLHLEVR